MTLTPASLHSDATGKTIFVNKELHAAVKAAAKRKFKIYPSAYANAWMVREYKKRGGKFRNDGLDKWFKEKWVRMSSSGRILGPCGDRSKGEGKPKCLPAAKAMSLSPAERRRLVSPQAARRPSQGAQRRPGDGELQGRHLGSGLSPVALSP